MIPKRIFQTWKAKPLTPALDALRTTWITHNPDYEYSLYDDGECAAFLAAHFPAEVSTAFARLRAGAFKADLWRLCILYIYGGVYADLDTVCMNSLDTYLAGDAISFVSVIDYNTSRDEGKHNVFNAFLAATPQHPILKWAIDRIVHQVSHNIVPASLLDVCGPGVLGRAVNVYFGREETASVLDMHGDHPNGVRLLYFAPGTGYVHFASPDAAFPLFQNKNGSNEIVHAFDEAYHKYRVVSWVRCRGCPYLPG